MLGGSVGDGRDDSTAIPPEDPVVGGHAWRAVKRRPFPAYPGAVPIAGVLAFGAVGVTADQGPELVRSGFRPTASEQTPGPGRAR